MPAWISNLFVHPEFILPGMALLSLPVIIHLINRLRYRRVKWAAMEFLLASQQQNKRRVLLEQLLLLLLRMLLVAALVLLVARPLIDPEQFSLFQGLRTHHVVLLDDSGSMRDRWGETTAFEEGKEVLRKISAEGERKPDTQALTLVLASRPEQPLFTHQNLNTDFVSRLETTLKGLQSSHGTPDLAAAAEQGRKLLAAYPGGARNFHLISDFRESDWNEDTALANVLRTLEQEKVAVNLVRTVAEEHPNLGITDLSGAVDVAAANVPLRLSATIRNYGQQVAKDVRLSVLVDGKKLPTTEIVETLEPGKEATREFDVVFPNTGPHDVDVVLPADALEPDNTRFLSLELSDTNPILIIDGSPANSEAFYLADALAPAPGITGFAPSIETLEYLRRRPIDRFQSVFLLNIAELPPDALRTLEQFVEKGGGLFWYLGEQVRPAFYNDRLYKEGHGLFPAKLAGQADLTIDETNPAADLNFETHPVFRIFEGEENPFLDLVKVNRFFSVPRDWTAPDRVRTIATLRNKAPLLFEHRFGAGIVLTCTTSLGTGWNNWPRIPPTFVSMQLEAAKYIARKDRSANRRIVGEPIVLSLDAATYSPQVEIQPPHGARESLMLSIRSPAEPAEGTSEKSAALPRYEESFRNTDEPGVYAVSLKRQDEASETIRYAFNVPSDEGRLKLAPTETLQRHLGAETEVTIQEPGDFAWVSGKESTRDIHDYVLIALIVALLAEQALALRLSYHPKSAGGRT